MPCAAFINAWDWPKTLKVNVGRKYMYSGYDKCFSSSYGSKFIGNDSFFFSHICFVQYLWRKAIYFIMTNFRIYFLRLCCRNRSRSVRFVQSKFIYSFYWRTFEFHIHSLNWFSVSRFHYTWIIVIYSMQWTWLITRQYVHCYFNYIVWRMGCVVIILITVSGLVSAIHSFISFNK